MNRWLTHVLQTTDSMFPTGAYAHSFGLEGLVQLGVVKDGRTLRTFLERQHLPSLIHVELPFLRAVMRASSPADVLALEQRYHAMKGTRELREASLRIGSQRLTMITPWLASRGLVPPAGLRGHAVIVAGLEAAWMAVPEEAAQAAWMYSSTAGWVSAAMKLIRMGHTEAQNLLHDLLTHAALAAEAGRDLAVDDAGWFSPLAELASAQHERAYTRLFIS